VEDATPLNSLRPEQRAAIERGEPLVCNDPSAASESGVIQGFVLLPERPDVVWDFCCDWGNINKLVPSIRYDVIERTKAAASEQLAMRTEVRLGPVKMNIVSQAQFDHAAREQRWRLASPEEIAALRARGSQVPDNSSFVRAVRGRSRFIDHGGRCLLVYENDMTPAARLPKPIQDFLTRRGLHSYLAAFAKWFAPRAAERAAEERKAALSN
jgi:hypothetical protein